MCGRSPHIPDYVNSFEKVPWSSYAKHQESAQDQQCVYKIAGSASINFRMTFFVFSWKMLISP